MDYLKRFSFVQWVCNVWMLTTAICVGYALFISDLGLVAGYMMQAILLATIGFSLYWLWQGKWFEKLGAIYLLFLPISFIVLPPLLDKSGYQGLEIIFEWVSLLLLVSLASISIYWVWKGERFSKVISSFMLIMFAALLVIYMVTEIRV